MGSDHPNTVDFKFKCIPHTKSWGSRALFLSQVLVNFCSTIDFLQTSNNWTKKEMLGKTKTSHRLLLCYIISMSPN